MLSVMAILERIQIEHLSGEAVARTLIQLIQLGDRGDVNHFLKAINDECTRILRDGDAHAIVLYRDRLGRIMRPIAELQDDVEAALAGAYLAALRDQVEDALTHAQALSDARGREHDREGVRNEIYKRLVERPARPRDLASEYGLHPSQVSRVLKSLCDAGVVVRSAPPVTGDRRGLWYSAAPLANATAVRE